MFLVLCSLQSIKMTLYGIIIAIQVFRVYSATKIFVMDEDEPLTVAIVNIATKCFGSSERWSELLIIPENVSNEIVKKIYESSTISNSIVFPDNRENNESAIFMNCKDHFNAEVRGQESKPNAVVISTHGPKQLEFILRSMKNDVLRIWRPRSFFIIVLEKRCNLEECNKILKIIWDYWILNALILCSSNDVANRNESEIELYTFNPYSADHSKGWEMIINETVQVSISSGNFNHSWYILNKKYIKINDSFEDCGDLFFDKTSNLNGYIIPIGAGYSEFSLTATEPAVAKTFATDIRVLKTLAKLLRFDVAQVSRIDENPYAESREYGAYSCPLDDLYRGRFHLVAFKHPLKIYPGLEMTNPHDTVGACFISHIAGDYPQWMNLAVAKSIWIALGVGLLFSTLVLYLQNKPHGIIPAFLDAERLIIGSSIIRGSTVIKHRIILGSIFLVVLVIDGAIRGRFISVLTVSRPHPNLETLDQLKKEKIDMYGPNEYKYTLMDTQLKSKYHGDLLLLDCIDKVKRGDSQRVCFTDCTFLKYMALNTSIFHKASNPVWSNYAAFLTTINWPMTNRFSIEMRKLLESGIFDKWKSDLLRECEIDEWKINRVITPPYLRPTELNDMLAAFVLLFVGLSTALIAFGLEMKSSGKKRSVFAKS